MKVIIMKSEDKEAWYKNKIGSTGTVIKDLGEDYIIKLKNYSGSVKKTNCEVIDK